MAKNQIDVTLDSRQLSEIKKSHHQDILKVIGSIDKITKSINTLSYRLEELGDKIDAISDILYDLERSSQGRLDEESE